MNGMKYAEFRNVVICSRKLQDRLKRVHESLWPKWMRGSQVLADDSCHEKFAYHFNDKGEMATLLSDSIEDELPAVFIRPDIEEDFD